MLGAVVHGVHPDILPKIPENALTISLSDLVKMSGLTNVVSGHRPDIRLFKGVGDALVCRAGQRTLCLGVPLPTTDLRPEQATFLLERVAYSFHDWGAKEVLKVARHRGETGHEFLPPDQWVISPDEREWLWWAEQDVVNGQLVVRLTAPDRRDRVRAGPRPAEWSFVNRIRRPAPVLADMAI